MAFNRPINWHIEWHTPNFQNFSLAQVLKSKSLNSFIPIFCWTLFPIMQSSLQWNPNSHVIKINIQTFQTKLPMSLLVCGQSFNHVHVFSFKNSRKSLGTNCS